MNVNLLLDSIVAQTTVLLAQLATTSGSRTRLAHTANQVFLDLVSELKRQGLGNKVIADMFGLALRTYHDKIHRLSESHTFRGHSLSTAIFDFIQGKPAVPRQEVLRRFSRDNERIVRSVLRDLVETGLLFRTGKGAQVAYKAATAADAMLNDGSLERTANLLWVTIHHFGPLTLEEMAAQMRVPPLELQPALEELLTTARVVEDEPTSDVKRYRADDCVIERNNELGWEGAVFDHYQAVVSALTARLRDNAGSLPESWQGGTTFTYNLWEGHPHLERVASFLEDSRKLGRDLRRQVEDYNRTHEPEERRKLTFLAYVGQSVRDEATGDDDEN